MPTTRFTILSFVFLLICFCGIRIYTFEQKRRAVKEDLIELSRIKYGLFSVDEWKIILSEILSKKIEELNFSTDQKKQVRASVAAFLEKTFNELEARFHEEKSKTIGGKFQSLGVGVFGVFEKMKKDIPVFTEQILDFLNNPTNRDTVKSYILEKLTEYTDETFGEIDYNEHCRIIDQYALGDSHATIAGLKNELNVINNQAHKYILAIYLLSLFVGVLLIFNSTVHKNEFVIYALICLTLLACGLFMPMIEIDARIEAIAFSLLGEPVKFTDQVLYYKSKSILEVVRHMLQQEKWDVFMVGMLVLLFSVLFPLSKLLCLVTYVHHPRSHNNKLIQFMVFKTGKWSMADVMVVAIFMSYIGFSGILTEQLDQIEAMTSRLDILTTNKSSLQTGFFLFTAFAILSLLVSHRLQYQKSPVVSAPLNDL